MCRRRCPSVWFISYEHNIIVNCVFAICRREQKRAWDGVSAVRRVVVFVWMTTILFGASHYYSFEFVELNSVPPLPRIIKTDFLIVGMKC